MSRLSLMESLRELKRTYNSVASETSLEYNDAQSLIPIVDIKDGMIFTSDGRIISILEIIPVNFFELGDEKQNMVCDSFGESFKQLPGTGQFKIMDLQMNLEMYEKRILSSVSSENNPKLYERALDHLALLKNTQLQDSTCKRFFYIFEYEGNSRKVKSDEYEEIRKTMKQNLKDTRMALESTGNAVIPIEDSYSLAEILYQFFNPYSSQTETLEKRIEKLNQTAKWLGQTPCLKDCIAPRGIRFGKWNYMVMDNTYYSYFAISDIGFPSYPCSAWLLNIVNKLPNCDVDLFYRINESTVSDFITDRTDVISRGIAMTHDSSEIDKQEELNSISSNARYIKNAKKNGEDLYDVCVIATLRSKTYAEMLSNIETFTKAMKKIGVGVTNCFAKTDLYFNMAMPILAINNAIFKSNKRNVTTSSMSSFYSFASYEVFDKSGYWLGLGHNGTLFGINVFSKRYVNPHVVILGTTGAGKTCTELAITSRMRMSGIKTMFILPLKGHEYKEAIESMGGEFISLYPGTNNCVNICEIRPIAGTNTAEIEDEELKTLLANRTSLLAEKVSSLITWFGLLLNKNEVLTSAESGRLNVLFTRVYTDRGFSEDNLSIFIDNDPKKGLKPMPIIEDLYNAIIKDEMLERFKGTLEPWIFGTCKNMNGQTNVSLSNKCIAFDVNEDKTTVDYLPAYMYIAFDLCYQVAQQNLDEPCCITLDETWKFLGVPTCSEYIFKMIKILRAYKTCLISASQNIKDFLKNDYSAALLSLPAIKILLNMNKDELKLVRDSVTLSARNEETIQAVRAGEGFYCANNDRIRVEFTLSDLELMLYSSQPRDKEAYRQILIDRGYQGELVPKKPYQ